MVTIIHHSGSKQWWLNRSSYEPWRDGRFFNIHTVDIIHSIREANKYRLDLLKFVPLMPNPSLHIAPSSPILNTKNENPSPCRTP